MASQKIISGTSVSQKKQTIVGDHIHYIYYLWKSLETLNFKPCLQKNESSSFISHLSKKIGTLKGPKESSADSELLNFSLAWILLMDAIGYSRIQLQLATNFFPAKGSMNFQHRNLYIMNKRRNFEHVHGFFVYQPWLTNAHRFCWACRLHAMMHQADARVTRLWPFVLQVSARLGFAWTVAISSHAASQASCNINMLQCCAYALQLLEKYAGNLWHAVV